MTLSRSITQQNANQHEPLLADLTEYAVFLAFSSKRVELFNGVVLAEVWKIQQLISCDSEEACTFLILLPLFGKKFEKNSQQRLLFIFQFNLNECHFSKTVLS